MPEQEQKMDRTSISLPEKQVEKIDQLVENGVYPNRSEFVREAVRSHLSCYDLRRRIEGHEVMDETKKPVTVASPAPGSVTA